MTFAEVLPIYKASKYTFILVNIFLLDFISVYKSWLNVIFIKNGLIQLAA